jgi:ubiquinone/menaquinone biosynthesis C-methylase UbiE
MTTSMKLTAYKRDSTYFKEAIFSRGLEETLRVAIGHSLNYAEEIESLFSLTDFTHDDIVVDLGCGTGGSIEQILKHSPKKVIGVDISPNVLKTTSRRLRSRQVQFRQGSAQDLSSIVAHVDKVVAVNFLDYFSELPIVLQQTRHVLKRDGGILFNVGTMLPYAPSIFGHLVETVNLVLNRSGLAELTIPRLRELEPKYSTREISSMTSRGQYTPNIKVLPIISHYNDVQNIYGVILESIGRDITLSKGKGLKTVILNRIERRLKEIYQNGLKTGEQAYVYARKR